MLAHERIDLLLDEDSPFLEFSTVAAYGTQFHVGASLVTGLGVVSGTECVLIAHDPTVRAGASNPYTWKKVSRALQIARENRLPVINLVESAGGDLPSQAELFLPAGKLFHDLTVLSANGIPTIALVFGNSTAGGAYVPGMCDYAVLVKEQAKVFLGGPPLVKMATGEDADDESLGGADMHARVSGLADYMAEDELECIRIGRQIVADLGFRKLGRGPDRPVEEPVHDPEELLGIVSVNLKVPFDPREVLTRIVDGSEFSEYKPLYGPALVTGWCHIHGYRVGVLANAHGVLQNEEAQKATEFILLANQNDTPLIFLQNTTGYIVGTSYEQRGIIKDGAKMINAVTELHSAAHHDPDGRLLRRRQLRHVGPGLRPPLRLHLAQRQDGRYGPGATGRRHVDRGPPGGGQRRPGVRRGRGRQAPPGDRGADRRRVAGSVPVGPPSRRRDHRPPRHPRRPRHVPLRRPLQSRRRPPRLRRLPDVSPVRSIRTLLVANRGEVARRVFRTCREIGVRTVAVYTPPDAGAPFVTEADAAVPLDGARGYLDIGQILAAAEATGADAVHPGWGFLAENAAFAEACIAAGLTWVGPPPPAMESMGSKIEARRLMEAAGVPVVPGATLSPAGDGGSRSGLPTKDVGKPLGQDAAIAAAGESVGFPLLVKASAGGGGKGMRLVTRAEDLAAAVTDAAREAAAAFGDPAVFLERYVSPGRHVEVQVIGDHQGTVVHLFERDCSVQRRHQKLVEESTSPAVDDDLRARMGQAAVAAAEAVGYHGVGTVEFLLGPDGAFYFLEMNTRLQVEHPVTELVTGLDLVRLQLAVAEGRPLPPEVHGARITGHAVEVRLYAEDPLHDYQPQTGRVEAIEFPDLPGLRLDSGVEAGSVIGTDYDSMLAKVIATGPTRAEAVRFLIDALRRARIHGVGTNRDLLLAILDHDEFGAGQADTGFLDRHPPDELLAPTLDPAALRLHALAAALAASAAARAAAPVLRPVRSGFRNNPGPPAVRRFTAGDTELAVGYRLGRSPRFTVDGEDLAVEVLDARSDGGGTRRRRCPAPVRRPALFVPGVRGCPPE